MIQLDKDTINLIRNYRSQIASLEIRLNEILSVYIRATKNDINKEYQLSEDMSCLMEKKLS